MHTLSILDGPPAVQTLSLHESLKAVAEKEPDSLAVACLHQDGEHMYAFTGSSATASKASSYLRWTHAQLAHAGHQLAIALLRAGIRPSMRVACFMDLGVEWHMVLRAAVELKCPLACLNPKATTSKVEMNHILKIVKPDIIVVQSARHAQQLEDVAPEAISTAKMRLVVKNDDLVAGPKASSAWLKLESFLSQSLESVDDRHDQAEKTLTDLTYDPDDVVLVLTTSGTTALPKGCPLTNSVVMSSSMGFIELGGLDKSRIKCHGMPLFHCTYLLIQSPSEASLTRPPIISLGSIFRLHIPARRR